MCGRKVWMDGEKNGKTEKRMELKMDWFIKGNDWMGIKKWNGVDRGEFRENLISDFFCGVPERSIWIQSDGCRAIHEGWGKFGSWVSILLILVVIMCQRQPWQKNMTIRKWLFDRGQILSEKHSYGGVYETVSVVNEPRTESWQIDDRQDCATRVCFETDAINERGGWAE
jgi:hypothetical protein